MSKASFVKLAMGVGVIALSSVATYAAEGSFFHRWREGSRLGVHAGVLHMHTDQVLQWGQLASRWPQTTSFALTVDSKVLGYLERFKVMGTMELGHLHADLSVRNKSPVTTTEVASTSNDSDTTVSKRSSEDRKGGVVLHVGPTVRRSLTSVVDLFGTLSGGIVAPTNKNCVKALYPIVSGRLGLAFKLPKSMLLEFAGQQFYSCAGDIRHTRSFNIGVRYNPTV